VSSPQVWSISSRLALYVTGNGGRAWTRVPAPRTYGKGNPVWGFSMISRSRGWLAAADTPCGSAPMDLCSVPVLLRTADGGRTWQPIGEGCAACGAPASGATAEPATQRAQEPARTVVPKSPHLARRLTGGELDISDPGRQQALEVVAGTGVAGWAGDGGPATRAEVAYPTRLVVANPAPRPPRRSRVISNDAAGRTPAATFGRRYLEEWH